MFEPPRIRLRSIRPIALLLLVVAASLPVSGAVAAARSYWIEDFAATIVVGADGVIDVTEEIRFYFDGSYRGIYRDIPLRYRDNLGFNYRLRLEVVSVTDGEGVPLRYELSDASGGRRRITAYVPGAQDAARTVTIRYRVERALRFFPEHDELYWNVTGTEWGVPIRAASVRVVLPADFDEQPRVMAYVGAYGSRGDSWRARSVSSYEVEVAATRELAYGEGLSVVVGWPKGAVHEPGIAERAGWLMRDNWPLFIPILVFLSMFTAWRRFGRDPEIGRSIMPMYHPPADLTPAEIGALVDERVDQRDIVATVIDLAVRGYLRIEEETEKGWFSDTTTTTLQRLEPAGDELRPHEREVLDGLFASGDRVTLDDLENEFYKRMDSIRTYLYDGLVEAGYFRSSPQSVRRTWVVIGVLVGAVSIPLGVLSQSVAGVIAGVASGAIVFGFAWFMPARTRAGRHKWVEVKGFEEFLGRTEGDRLRSMDVDLSKFETFLPYAMALGVAEQWGRAFEGLLQRPPEWYLGPHRAHFSPALFSQRMSTVSRAVGTAMATAPRSSSGSSGFSGGGFSGGGFGGGGGGAF